MHFYYGSSRPYSKEFTRQESPQPQPRAGQDYHRG
jgi:hypothetical protein